MSVTYTVDSHNFYFTTKLSKYVFGVKINFQVNAENSGNSRRFKTIAILSGVRSIGLSITIGARWENEALLLAVDVYMYYKDFYNNK